MAQDEASLRPDGCPWTCVHSCNGPQEDRIPATSTLMRTLPEPVHQIIGDLSRIERVQVGLDLVAKS